MTSMRREARAQALQKGLCSVCLAREPLPERKLCERCTERCARYAKNKAAVAREESEALDRKAFVNDVDVLFVNDDDAFSVNYFAIYINDTVVIVRGGVVMEIVRRDQYARGFGSRARSAFENELVTRG